MKGFCNNIYNNVHDIIGWDPNEGNNNVERRTALAADARDVGDRGSGMSEGGVKMVLSKHSPIPIRLWGEGTENTTTYNTADTVR